MVVQDALVGVRMNVLDAQAVRAVRGLAQMAVQGLVKEAVQEAVKKVAPAFVQMVARTNALVAA